MDSRDRDTDSDLVRYTASSVLGTVGACYMVWGLVLLRGWWRGGSLDSGLCW